MLSVFYVAFMLLLQWMGRQWRHFIHRHLTSLQILNRCHIAVSVQCCIFSRSNTISI